MTRNTPLKLAFVDPGLRKAPFFLELRAQLEPRVHCVYYSRRTIVRGFVRSGGAPLFPNLWQRDGVFEISDEDLRSAIGEKEWATRGAKLMPRARRLLHSLARFYEAQGIEAVMVWNGSNLLVSLAVYLAQRLGLPVIFAEHGYFPRTLQVDSCGVNFDASLTPLAMRGAALLPPDTAIDRALDREIDAYRQGRPMRANNASVPPHLRRDLRSFVHREIDRRIKPWFRRKFPGVGMDNATLPERFVFLPFQVRKDSQLIVHSPLLGNDMARLLELLHGALAQVDPQMRIVVKFHPRENPKVQARYLELMRQYPDVLFIRRQRLGELLEKAAAVVTVNSTVGFEAFLYDKPVVTLGRNFYTAPGLVETVQEIEQLPEALRRALSEPVDHGRRRGFLRYVHARFLVFGDYNDYSQASLDAVAARICSLLGLPETRAALIRPAASTPTENVASAVGASSRDMDFATPAVR